MAAKIFLGNASAIAQVENLTVGGTAANGQSYSVTIGFDPGKTVSYTAGGTDTNTTIATALQALLAASLFPEFKEILWANPSDGVISATAVSSGVPFALTAAATGSGTLTAASVVVNSGTNDISVAANWSGGALPANGDDVYFQSSNIAALYGLNALASITPANVYFDASYTPACGLPVNNVNSYREYRTRHLQLAGVSGIVSIGQGQGQGSGKIQLDFQTGTFNLSAWKMATSTETGLPALQIKGGSSSSMTNIFKGTVGLALLAGETAATGLNVDYVANQASDAQIWSGPGCTFAGTVNMNGGKLVSRCPVDSLTCTGGTAQVLVGDISSVRLNNGAPQAPPSTLQYNAGGTIASYSVGKNCLLDCSGTLETTTLTSGTIYAGGTINAPYGNLTMTDAASIPDGQASDVTLNLGSGRHVQVS